MLRLRTIEQAAAEIKKADPDTAITKYAIRQLVISREIPSIQRGNKYLINLDTLLAYLGGEAEAKPEQPQNVIHMVAER